MSKWNETGILRKKQVKDNFDDLLVFGYACKLFKDDEKATYVDQGKHLIPWMGDEKIKIDRYDGRGALSDLSSCEASKEGFDAMRWLGLTDSDRKLEQLCDEERYYSLIMNEEEEAMYKEEETKRQKTTNEFQYSYDVPRDPEAENSNSQDSIPIDETDLEPFVPPTELDVPVDINIPKTIKVNARIEKTALFVSKQGPQMEILIKAKQSDNPQFNFMNQSDTLYKYYRHVLSAIKSGRYKTQAQQEAESIEAEARYAAAHSVEEHYLHPTLAQPQALPLVNHPPKLPPIPYKPAANCAYTQLISRIQGNGPMVDPPPVVAPPPPPADPVPQQMSISQMTPDQQQQYYQYYYSMQYYEYYKQIVQQYAVQAGCEPQTIIQNTQLQEQIQTQAAHYAQTAYNQYVQQNTNNPYAQIVTNLAQNVKDHAPIAAAAPLPVEPEIPPQTNDLPKKNLLSLVYYSSDSEDDDEIEEETVKKDVKTTFKVPPEDVATIIDKMANYVSKNGADFENSVRAKGDPRFQFLNENHEFFKYYKHKLGEYSPQKIKETRKIETKIVKEKKIIAPVSFSLKKPREETDLKSALPLEESDEEEELKPNDVEATPAPVVAPPATPAVPCAVTSYRLTDSQQLMTSAVIAPSVVVTVESAEIKDATVIEDEKKIGGSPAVVVVVEGAQVVQETTEKNTKIFDDPIFEMIDLTDDLEERRDARRAENKIKDKIALAAKEKLSSKSRDRALQLERRKKAAMFLKLKSVENHPTVGGETRTVSKTTNKSSSDLENKRVTVDDRVQDKKEKEVILKIDDSESEEGEIKHRRKVSKKKKSHKRKSSRSRSRYESKTAHHSRRSKKRKKRTPSQSSESS